MAGRLRNSLIALLLAAVSGCSTAPAHFYALEATAASDSGAAPLSGRILVVPVSVPAAVDRPQLVVQTAPNRLRVDEFHRWAAPLSEGIAEAVAGDLVRLLGTPDVAVAPLANFKPTYVVTIEVQRFESVAGQSATIDAVWTVRKTGGAETRVGRTVAREAVPASGVDALAAAHSRALVKLSGDIAAAIRGEAETARNGETYEKPSAGN